MLKSLQSFASNSRELLLMDVILILENYHTESSYKNPFYIINAQSNEQNDSKENIKRKKEMNSYVNLVFKCLGFLFTVYLICLAFFW